MSEAKLDHIIRKIDEQRKETEDHGKILARLDERSLNQKDRLDRVEKKSALIGAVTGSLTALGVVITKALGFDG